ncbi:MAG: DUF4421 domain-containing protein [Flavobacteriales bacterium]|nr:DUF4421 family protein [Flavobacteriales bacterium]
MIHLFFSCPRKQATWLLALLALPAQLRSQHAPEPRKDFDTLYVRDYSHIVSGRVYGSTKINNLTLGSDEAANDLIYRPNNRINMGVGASYRALTLNIGFPVPFLNNDNDVRGKTSYLDMQANIYTKRTASNLFLQTFGGYYLDGPTLGDVNWDQDTERPYRPDVRQFNVGVSSVRILSSDRFSYRASFNQDAWQRRSQGSWLVGAYATYFTARADSSLVPSTFADRFSTDLRMRRGDFGDLGPMGGAVYTFVHREHLFLTLSGVIGAGITAQHTVSPVPGDDVRNFNLGPGWHAQLRASMGYNSRRYYVGLAYNQEQIGYLLGERERFTWSVSNIRFNIVKRFDMHIGFMDRGLRWLKRKVPEPIEDIVPE